MANKYFLGDPHWGHKNILKYRTGFSSIEQHDEYITENILDVTGKRDTLWLTGDVIFTEEHIDRLVKISNHVGHLNWILGNHDTENRQRQKILRELLSKDVFHKVGGLFSENGFWISHAPLHPDELRGRKNIHSHVHGNIIDDPRYIDVSCESIDFTPIDLNCIKQIMEFRNV